MQIYLKHPVHGRKIASLEMEAVYDEKHGWTRYNPDTLVTPVEVPIVAPVLEEKRRGRPPKTKH